MDSLASEDKVTTILNQVSELSESEKYVLYLKLPDITEESSKDPPSSMSRRNNLALHWIRTYYVEDREIYVQKKEDVYEQYRQHCEASGNNPLSSCNFGKMMKLVFPNIHNRRLGQRGKSEYFFSGLRRKEHIDSSSPTEVLSSVQTKEDLNLYTLSCQLVCEWATQLLERPFVDIRNLSEYLVSKGLSCGKTAAKFSLLSGSTSPPKLFGKDRKSPNSKHHDRQMLLQRKLQHNELIREHKEKLKQQQKQLRELYSVSAGVACPLKGDEPVTTLLPGIPGKKIQPRPSSVQPYVRNVSSTFVSKNQEIGSFTDGLSFDRAAASKPNTYVLRESATQIISAGRIFSADNACFTGPTLPIDMRESVTTPLLPKRCHSTSVVEKQSSSLLFGMPELVGQALEKHHSSADTNSSCEMNDEKVSSFSSPVSSLSTSVDIQTISSSESVSKKLSTSASVLPPSGAQRNITKMLESPVPRASTDGLLMPQHPKRYGDNISPDRSSLTKRKCTTSLGVTKQQSLETSVDGSENPNSDLPRLRPYSCPVSIDVSQFDSVISEEKSLSNNLFVEVMCKNKPGASKEKLTSEGLSQTTVTRSPILLSDRRKNDERKKTRPEQQQKKNASICHFVQKPTVINRPKHVLHTVTSCPDLKQETLGEVSHVVQESSTEKQSYNILNSLLSSNYDALSERTLPTSPLSSSLTSSYLGTHTTTEASNPCLQSSQLRLITNTSHPGESPSILSSLPSRSAFVPVTSLKLQVANSTMKETEIMMGVQSPRTQSTSLIQKKDQDPSVPSTTINSQPVESLNSDSAHTLVKPAISHMLISESSVIPTHNEYNLMKDNTVASDVKFRKYIIDVTSSSSSSSSSSSTLCRSGESMSSGCDSVLTTPVPAPITEKYGEAIHLSTLSVKNSVIPSTSGSLTCSPVAQCKSSSSVGCTTPVTSPHICPVTRSFQTRTTTSPITPPKRASRNRFTPIRPKLGGGTNTPSPQKLGGMTTPSPQKKDMRPVSAILKEQRVKCAQDLLVNLANNYQGEVKLQMPAELLGLSPAGKSKSADVRVTIRSPSNSMNILQHKNTQPQSGSSDLNQQLWSLNSPTPPNKEITVIVEPVSQPSGYSTLSPALSSCLISTTPTQLLQSLPQPLGVQVVAHNLCSSTMPPKPLFSPTASFQGQSKQSPLAFSTAGSGTQVIILPPSISCISSPQISESRTSKPIIVEDDKGNKYSLDQKSASVVLPQNLQHFFNSNQSTDSITPLNPNTSFTSSTSSHLNVSEIKGHVIGPDSNGQTYLIVPNSEPVIQGTTVPNFLYQQLSPALSTTLTVPVTRSQIIMQPGVSCASIAGIVKPHETSSSALLSELSQLATSAGQNMSGQTLIQHNSGSSAFHKCSSSMQRRMDNISESTAADRSEQHKDISLGQFLDYELIKKSFSKRCCPTGASSSVKPSREAIDVSSDRQTCDEASYSPKYQGMRKRKASRSQDDEHEDRKRLNSSRDQNEEGDDDVFIVKVEDNFVPQTASENSDTTESSATEKSSGLHCSHLSISASMSTCDQSDSNLNRVITEETTDDTKKILTDTETLLGMIEDSKSMTVKETIRALNELRARQNQNVSRSNSTSSIDIPVHCERPVPKESLSYQDVNLSSETSVSDSKEHSSGSKTDFKIAVNSRSQSARCSSVSPYPLSDACQHALQQEITSSPHTEVPKIERTGRRHISLNLESLESDALLDTEPTLDHRLVGDIQDATSVKSDQKTSVGIAVKSARSTGLLSSSDRNAEYKNKSKQQKRDIRASKITLLNDKKDLDKVFSCVSKKESMFYSLSDKIKYKNNTALKECTKPGNESQQNVVENDAETKSELVPEQRRSMSCVRDILQRGTKHGFISCVSSIGDKITANSKCQNVKPLSLSNLNQSSVNGSKASEHPLLAQCLSIPSRGLLKAHLETDKNQTSTNSMPLDKGPVSFSEQNDAKGAKSNSSENELPVDIADFITESMSAGSSYSCDAFRGNSLTTLLADLVRNGQAEREQTCTSDNRNVTVWRSVSVPNTIPDDFKIENAQKDCGTSKNYPLSYIRSQATAESGNGPQTVERPTKKVFSNDQSSTPLCMSWEGLTDAYRGVTFLDLNTENVKEKDMSTEHSSLSSDGGASFSSGTFLSPIGPARLTRRSSVERSSSGDRSMTKTPVEGFVNKSSTERSLPRIKTPTDRTMTKIPVDRSHTQTPVDRSLSLTPIDRTARRISREMSPSKMDYSCRDHTTAAVLQQSSKERDPHKQSSAEKVLSNLVCESLFIHRPLDGLTHHGLSADSTKGDRSLNQTPMSDAGYSSVSETPISDVGYSSVSPSPVMMSIPGLFGECGRQELTSPATIFMPLRSDSVISMVNNNRSNDGIDSIELSVRAGSQGGCLRSVSNIPQCLHTTVKEDCEKADTKPSFFDRDTVSQETSVLQNVIDGSLLDLKKDDTDCGIIRTPEGHSIKDTLSFLDFEKFMSAQLNCIPTPPRSPSTSPLHLADTSQSPLSFSVPSSHTLPPPHSQQSWVTPTSSMSLQQMTQFSSVTTISSQVTCLPSNSLHIISSSPGFVSCAGQHSPHVLPNISPLPHGITHPCSSPHQYNPHPSPPFTPSSQRSLASPRCPTPCSHRSLMSPCCATPCADSNSAPNRFMPIQTSGILATSLTATKTYIQPIRPVVTLASLANQNNQANLDFSHSEHHFARSSFSKTSLRHTEPSASNMMNLSHDQNSSTLLKSDAANVAFHSKTEGFQTNVRSKEDDTFPHQRKFKTEDHKSERCGHPALILSLTGSIGSVSGQGMQAGWKKDITGPTSPSSMLKKGHNSNTSSYPLLHAQSTFNRLVTDTGQEEVSGLPGKVSPTYEEALSLLDGQDTSSYPTNITENLTLPADSSNESAREFSHYRGKRNLGLCEIVDLHSGGDSEKSHKQLLFSRSTSVLSQTSESLKSSLQRESEQLFSSNVNSNISDNTEDFPFSQQLAKLNDQSRPVSKEQHSQADDCRSHSRTSSQDQCQNLFEDRYYAETSRTSNLTAMLQAPAFVSCQSGSNSFNTNNVRQKPFHHVSDLPTAYYSGTAPNIDLTKALFALASLPAKVASQPATNVQNIRSETQLEAFFMNVNSQLDRRLGCTAGNQDELDETLDVLKSLDSQYFQHDDDSNNSETTG